MKKGLGRGLDALLDPYMESEESAQRSVIEVDIRRIDTNRQQPRKNFDEDALKELADSISIHGVVQPLIVKKKGERYTIVAGERRFRAARMAKLEKVPVLLVDYNDAEMQEVALIENIQREDLNPVEEAAAIQFLMKQHDMTQEEVSTRLGKSRPAVTNALRLLHLPKSVLEMVKEGTLTAGHGRALAGVADRETQEKLADECVRLGYSVRALESRIQNLQAGKQTKKRAPEKRSTQLTHVEGQFREKLGTRVKIVGDEQKGRITIEYYSGEDLQRVYECIVAEEA